MRIAGLTGKPLASARVKLEVEVTVGSAWGEDCSIKQVYDQAAREAIGKLEHACQKSETHGIRIVGEPQIVAVLAERK